MTTNLLPASDTTCGACHGAFDTLADVFSHDCPAITADLTRRNYGIGAGAENVDAPERREATGKGSARPPMTNKYAGTCQRCSTTVEAGAGRLVKDHGAWLVYHRDGGCVTVDVEAALHNTDTPAPAVRTAAADHRPNRFAGTCRRCSKHVEAMAGRLVGEPGAWSVEHVDCTTAPAVEAPAKADLAAYDVPAGRYAVENETGDLRFYIVDRPTEGRWAGRVFVKVMHSDERSRLFDNAAASVLAKIVAAGPFEAMLRYGREIGSCGHCGRTLTDEASRAAGIGPVCAGKYR